MLYISVLLLSVAAVLLRWLYKKFVTGCELSWETGRRKARQNHKAQVSYFAHPGVVTSEDYFVNSRGIELFTKQWMPVHGLYRGVVLYCHGYADTCSYSFEDVAVHLAAEGYAVAAIDYEGHGLSAGLHCYISRFDNLVDDVGEFATFLAKRPGWAGLPLFLFGESMGGAVALKAHRRFPDLFHGAILQAPMCKISEKIMPPPVVVAVLKVFARIIPQWKIVPRASLIDVAYRQSEKRRHAMMNPVGYTGSPRVGTAWELLKATQEIEANLSKVALPLLIQHGGADVVTDPRSSETLYEEASSTDKSLRIYDGCWHTLTSGEPDEVVATILKDVTSWLDARSEPLERVPELESIHSHLRGLHPRRLHSWKPPASGMLSSEVSESSESISTVTS